MNAADENLSFAGQREFLDEEYDRALPLLLPVAQSGHAEAQCMVGNVYHLGLGSVSPDIPRAIDWYVLAAEQGYGVASSNLAGLYLVGSGVSVDRVRSQQLYEQAQKQFFVGGWSAAE